MGWEGGCGLNSSASGLRQVVSFCESGNEPSIPQNVGNFLSSSGPVRFSGMTVLHGVS